MSGKEKDLAHKDVHPQPATRNPLDRPYVCGYPGCPSRFTRNDELRRHQRLLEHGPENSRHGNQAALANGNVSYNGGHSRRQSEQLAVGRSQHSLSSHARSGIGVLHHSSSHSNREQLPPRPATSMNSYSSGHERRPAARQSSSVVQPIPRYPSRNPAFMPSPRPGTPMHPLPPSHNRAPTAGVHDFISLRLPPLRANWDDYTADSGLRRRRMQLSRVSEVAGKLRDVDRSQH